MEVLQFQFNVRKIDVREKNRKKRKKLTEKVFKRIEKRQAIE